MKINFSLSLKLTLIILSTSVCIIVASTYITVNEQTRFFENAYSEKATALAQALDASIGSRNELEDKEKIHDYILKFIYTNKEDVLRISINLPENDELKVYVSSDSESEGFLSSQDNYISYEKDISISIPSHTDNSHTLTVITPLHISGQTIGTYEMLLSMDKAYASLNTHLTNIITTSIILLFILIITSTYLLRKIIVKPVTIFMDAANKIGEGKLDTKINIKSHDELGKLAKSFNKMAKDLKKSKAETEKYDKMLEEMLDQREEFINQLGHDLKNPLTPIVGLLPIISGEIKDPDIKKHLQVVMTNVEYMRNLITKTLQLARLRSTDIKFDIENMNLNEEINNILKTKNMLLREKEIEVKNKVDEKIMVKADKLRFRELFENLVSNAIKYTPKGGEAVTIDAKKEKRHIEVSVKDTGIGINKRQIKRVFDEFYKADKSRHELESSGLGLSICKRIVEKHGGHIWVESKGLGKGSTFYFTLETGERKNALMKLVNMMKTILAVDDEQDVIYTIKLGLEKLDKEIRVIGANSGEKCFEILKNEKKPDIILLDIMLPDMSGWQVLEKIKENKEWSDIPIIFLTARTDIVAKRAGGFLAEDYIEKPFEVIELKDRIDEILNKKTN